MTPPRALLLDLDNTAYAYAPCHEAGLFTSQHAAADLHAEWHEATRFRADYNAARREAKAGVAGTAAEHCRLLYFKTMVERSFGRTVLSVTLTLHAAYWRGYFAAMVRSPGSAELLADLREAGVRLAWVTNFTTERQMLKLQTLGLADAADFLVTSEEVGADKPDPRSVRRALDRLAVAPSEAWLVGDGIRDDADAATAVGIPFVWFRRESGSPPPAAMATVSDWLQLRVLLDEHYPGLRR